LIVGSTFVTQIDQLALKYEEQDVFYGLHGVRYQFDRIVGLFAAFRLRSSLNRMYSLVKSDVFKQNQFFLGGRRNSLSTLSISFARSFPLLRSSDRVVSNASYDITSFSYGVKQRLISPDSGSSVHDMISSAAIMSRDPANSTGSIPASSVSQYDN
jgi:hypothetical protein